MCGMSWGEIAWDILIGCVFVGGAVAIALGTYFITRMIAGRLEHERTSDLAGSVTFRVAGLHALIVALIFAQEMVNYQSLRNGFLEEATAVADIFFDLERYEAGKADDVRVLLARYVDTVVEDDWRELAENRHVSGAGYTLFESVYNAILDLQPQDLRQETLRDHMVARVHAITTYRQARTNAARDGILPLFWLAATAGLVLVSAPYFIYPPTPLHLSLLTVFAAYTGLVLFIIYAFTDPFSAPGAVQPTAFMHLLEGEIGRWVDGRPG
jgi:hypothetical protein